MLVHLDNLGHVCIKVIGSRSRSCCQLLTCSYLGQPAAVNIPLFYINVAQGLGQPAAVHVVLLVAIWDNLQLYMLMHLAPVLGDHHYSSRLRTFMGNKLVKEHQGSCEPEPQVRVSAHVCLSAGNVSVKMSLKLECISTCVECKCVEPSVLVPRTANSAKIKRTIDM